MGIKQELNIVKEKYGEVYGYSNGVFYTKSGKYVKVIKGEAVEVKNKSK